MMKKKQTFLLFILAFFALMPHILSAQTYYTVRSQKFDPYKLIGDTSQSVTIKMPEILMSRFITYKEYKVFLDSVKAAKHDTCNLSYNLLLPDTNIGNEEVYKKYIAGVEYDNFPVLGISWEAAMNYCKWKTLQENKGTINYIYRLPLITEWLVAYKFFKDNSVENDLNYKYSDWTLNHKEDYGDKLETSVFSSAKIYFHKQSDPPALKRKLVIGNSWLYRQNAYLNHQYKLIDGYSYYATQGYRQISFRIVKEKLYDEDGNKAVTAGAAAVLDYWKIKLKTDAK